MVKAINRSTCDELRTVEDTATQEYNHSHLSNEQKQISEQLRRDFLYHSFKRNQPPNLVPPPHATALRPHIVGGLLGV